MWLKDKIDNLKITRKLRVGAEAAITLEQTGKAETDLRFLQIQNSAGTGITAGTGTVYRTSVTKVGGIIKTEIFIDLTGLASSTTDLDIIGVGAGAAHIGQLIPTANGQNISISMQCLEVPAGGVTDIDVYYATEATGVFDQAVTALTETALITSGGVWTLALTRAGIAGVEAPANSYLYLAGGAAGVAGTYTAGKFLITLIGYEV